MYKQSINGCITPALWLPLGAGVLSKQSAPPVQYTVGADGTCSVVVALLQSTGTRVISVLESR